MYLVYSIRIDFKKYFIGVTISQKMLKWQCGNVLYVTAVIKKITKIVVEGCFHLGYKIYLYLSVTLPALVANELLFHHCFTPGLSILSACVHTHSEFTVATVPYFLEIAVYSPHQSTFLSSSWEFYSSC